MYVALRDLWRSKLRFGLLAGAIGLLVFLLLFLNTLSTTLVGFFIGAIDNNSADVLVYQDSARLNLQASRLDQTAVAEVASVPGVEAAAPIGELTLTAEVAGRRTDLSLWGVDLEGPGGPEYVVDGRLPGPGEVIVDKSGTAEGLVLGETITLRPSGTEIEIVGYVEDLRYAVVGTAYLGFDEWTTIFQTEFPGTPVVPISLVGADIEPGADLNAVVSQINAKVPGTEAVEPSAAAAGNPAVDSMSLSFTVMLAITFGIVVLVVGFFFLILTVQKLRSLTTLRAIGATTGYLARSLLIQIVAVVAGGALLATGVLWLATLGSSSAFPLSVDGRLVATIAGVVMIFSILAGLLAMRRIARANPADAAQGIR